MSILRIVLCTILALLAILPARAQFTPAPREDSQTTTLRTDTLSGWQRFERSQLGRGVIAGVPLIALAPLAKTANGDFRSLRHDFCPRYDNEFDNWLQYSPAVALIGMKLAGVEGESSWGEMLVADAAAVALMAGAVNITKRVVGEERPDETNRKSFPSGHTATAFMTATMLSHEYGRRYPWISLASYTVATSIGLMRMANNRHWANDVMMGAGIGIISTELGYLVSNLIFHKPLLGADDALCMSRDDRPTFVGLYMGSNIPLCSLKPRKGLAISTEQGATIGAEGAWFMNKNVGFGGRGTFSNINFADCDAATPDLRPDGLRMATLLAGAYFSLPLSARLQIGTKALAGFNYYYELNDKTYGHRIPSGGSFGAAMGLWVNFCVSESLSYKILCDYDVYTPQRATGRALQLLNVGGMASVTF